VALLACLRCWCRFAVGLVSCPHCGSGEFEEADVPKITVSGGPSAPVSPEPEPEEAAVPVAAEPEPAPEPEPETVPEPEAAETPAPTLSSQAEQQ
jgi:hypothetical protein